MKGKGKATPLRPFSPQNTGDWMERYRLNNHNEPNARSGISAQND
jgi:hypothetical protein